MESRTINARDRQFEENRIPKVQLVEFKEEPESEKDESETECILPDMEEEDPLRIDDKEREKDEIPTEKICTGFILWAADKRKEMLETNPQMSFYEISKLLHNEWNNLSIIEKNRCGKRAINFNLTPPRHSSRERKPKEIKDLSHFERKQTVSRNFTRNKSRLSSCSNNLKSENFNSVNEKVCKRKKTKTRYTAYSVWSQEVKVVLLKERPKMTFIQISKALSEMWKLVPNVQKYNYRRRAKRLTEKLPKRQIKEEKEEDVNISKVSSKGRAISKPTKLLSFENVTEKIIASRKKGKSSVIIAKTETEDTMKMDYEQTIANPPIENKEKKCNKPKFRKIKSHQHRNTDSLVSDEKGQYKLIGNELFR